MNAEPAESAPGRGRPRRGFLAGHCFPMHLFVIWDVLAAKGSTLFWTAWTKCILRAAGCPYGAGLRVDGRVVVRIRRRGAIRLGRNVRLKSRRGSNIVGLTGPVILHCIDRGSITFGDHSGCSGAVLSSAAAIRIGNYVKIGGNARLYDHDYHPLDFEARHKPGPWREPSRSAPITLEDDVFVGANCHILKGVTVGARSVIGAGAVVTLKSVPQDSLVAGNPARVIRRIDAAVRAD